MHAQFIAGSIFHPQKKTYVAAIGHHFSDAPGLYQFFVIGNNDHFRKRPDNNDYINEISYEVFDQFRKTRGA